MKFSMKGSKGFSLVELMIVVGIIGILATLAMPRMQTFMAKAKQAEVKVNLGHMYTLEMAYYGDNNAYGTETQIGFAGPTGVKYAYTVTASSATAFTAQGTIAANGLCKGSAIDTWTINEAQTMSNTAAFGTCN